jgi:hypothetical protein
MTSASLTGSGRSSGRGARIPSGTARSMSASSDGWPTRSSMTAIASVSGPTCRAANGGSVVGNEGRVASGTGGPPWARQQVLGRVLPLCRSGLRVSPVAAGFPRRRAHRGTFQSGLVRAVRVPERFPGGVAPSADGRAHHRDPVTLPPGVRGLVIRLCWQRRRPSGPGQGATTSTVPSRSHRHTVRPRRPTTAPPETSCTSGSGSTPPARSAG